jgi:hypothetical protein
MDYKQRAWSSVIGFALPCHKLLDAADAARAGELKGRALKVEDAYLTCASCSLYARRPSLNIK